ncbi:MAG: hypothetical protein AAGM67_19640, partial [Bacteroidota bacterium]
RTRALLVMKAHLPNHLGERQMSAQLSDYYFPSKRKFIRTFLDSCKCNPMKHAGNPNIETREQKSTLKFEVKKPFDIVQIDTYTYDDGNGKFHYLTAIDLKTKKGFCRKICKVGAQKTSHYYQRKLFEAYMFLESKFPCYPKQISCDNESSLVNVPHPNVVPGPVYYPQGQSLVENFHRRLAELSRFNKITPDEAAKHYNAGLPGGDEEELSVHTIFSVFENSKEPPLFHPSVAPANSNQSIGCEISMSNADTFVVANSDCKGRNEISDDAVQLTHAANSDHTIGNETCLRELSLLLDVDAKGYKGRELQIGDLVFQRKPARSRIKSDDYWHKL